MAKIEYVITEHQGGIVGRIVRYKPMTKRWLLRLVRDMFAAAPYRMSRDGITIDTFMPDALEVRYRDWPIGTIWLCGLTLNYQAIKGE